MTRRIAHIIQRAAERYALDLTEADVAQIDALLVKEDPCTRFIGFCDDGSARYTVQFRGRLLRVMFDVREAVALSLLPAHGECGGSFKMH